MSVFCQYLTNLAVRQPNITTFSLKMDAVCLRSYISPHSPLPPTLQRRLVMPDRAFAPELAPSAMQLGWIYGTTLIL